MVKRNAITSFLNKKVAVMTKLMEVMLVVGPICLLGIAFLVFLPFLRWQIIEKRKTSFWKSASWKSMRFQFKVLVVRTPFYIYPTFRRSALIIDEEQKEVQIEIKESEN